MLVYERLRRFVEALGMGGDYPQAFRRPARRGVGHTQPAGPKSYSDILFC